MLLRAVPVRHDRLEPSTIGGAHFDLDPLAHGHSLPLLWRQRESFVRLDPLALAIRWHNQRFAAELRLENRVPDVTLNW